MQIETALLIQGPLHQNTVLNVKANSCFAEILVSTWPPTDECQEEVMRQLKALGVRLIVNEMGAEKTMRCPPIIAHQTLTTLRGLELVKSKRVIKSRSDEWYELSGLADLLAQNPTRIVFSNFIVRPWTYHPYHVSDHLYGGGAEVLVNAFRAISVTDKEEFIEHLGPTHVQVAESLIGWMLFRSQVKSSPQASQDLLDFGVRPQCTLVWRTFMNLFQLYDLQKIEGKFECHARRAGVGPVTNLRTLVREHRQWGLVLDFVHYKHLRDLRPSSVRIVSAKKLTRYLWRRYLQIHRNP